MQFDATQALLPLAPDRPLRLNHARGTRLRSVAGTLWVTIDDDCRDLVLERGQSLVIDSARPVLVTALGAAATAGVCAPAQATPAWRSAWAQVRTLRRRGADVPRQALPAAA
jgi:hypothetical protein